MITDYIEPKTANVYGIYGHLGGGKSLTAVEISLWALRRGWSVTSNIQLFNIDRFSTQFHFVENFDQVDFWSLPCGAPRGSNDPFRSVIIIDECAEFFDQYSSTNPIVKNFLSWLRHSSKRGQFVFLIVQQPEFIAKSLRLLCNKWIVCWDMEQYKLPVFRFRVPFTRHLVSRRIFDKWGNLISRGANFADKQIIGQYYSTSQSVALAGRNSDYKGIPKIYKPDHFSLLLFIVILWEIIIRIYQ